MTLLPRPTAVTLEGLENLVTATRIDDVVAAYAGVRQNGVSAHGGAVADTAACYTYVTSWISTVAPLPSAARISTRSGSLPISS